MKLHVAAALLFSLSLPSLAQTTHGVDLSAIDTTAKPGDNFYLYANGNWIKRTTLPADRTSVGAAGGSATMLDGR